MKKEYFEKYEADMDSPLCKNCGQRSNICPCTQCQECLESFDDISLKDLDGEPFCESCYDDISVMCGRCHEMFHEGTLHSSSYGDLCDGCH